jgi:hypothetical protein
MTNTVLVQGKPCRPCVSIHRNGQFTYFDPLLSKWLTKDTVPTYVRSLLPDDEIHRVERKLRELGRI